MISVRHIFPRALFIAAFICISSVVATGYGPANAATQASSKKQSPETWTESARAETPQIRLTPEEKTWLAAHPDVTFGFTDSFEPFLIRGVMGQHSGILIDLLNDLNAQLGTQFTLEVDSWPVILKKVKNKELGAVLGVAHHTADAFGLLKTIPYCTVYPAFFAREDAQFDIKSLDDLRGKSVAILDKAKVMESILEPYGSDVDISRYPDNRSPLQMVFDGKVDLAFGLTIHAYYINKYGLFGVKPVHTLLERPSNVGMAVRTDWPELISILNKWLASYTEQKIDTIIRRWIDLPVRKKTIELTDEEEAWLDQKHTVQVRVVDYPPYQIINGIEEPQGIVIEYLKLIEKRTGIEFNYGVTDQTFADFLESMKQGIGPDMTALITPTLERKQYISFTEPYLSTPYVIFTREEENPIFDIQGLSGKTLAVPRGFVVQERLSTDYPEIKLALFDSDEKALQEVATGQADAYIGSLTVASHIIHKRGISNLKVMAPGPFEAQTLSMGVRHGWPELVSIIDKALADITEEEKTAIRSKYLAIKFEQGISKPEVLKWALIVGGLAFGIMLAFVVWNKQLSRKVNEKTSQLSESEMRFRATFEQAAVGVAIVLPNGKFLRVNRKFGDIVGYSQAEILDLNFQDITHPDDREDNLRYVRQLQSGEVENYSTDERYYCKDGSIAWGNLNVSLVAAQEGHPEYFVAVIKDISERKQSENKIAEYQKRLKALAYEVTLIEERERRAIAADLHDYVGQTLALARIQLASASRAASETGLADKLGEISDTLLKALEETQTLMLELGSHSIHDSGLSATISDWLESEIRTKHNLKTEITDSIPVNRRRSLPPDVRTILYRNVRELVVNVVKHARANRVSILIEEWDVGIRIVVDDDGIGFDTHGENQNGMKPGGFGLFRVEELMTDIGGRLHIVTAPGKGCTATLFAPVSVDDSRRRD